MGRPRKLQFPKDEPKKENQKTDPDVSLPPKKRRWKRGGIQTRRRITRAQGRHPVPRAVMVRLIKEHTTDGLRWSPLALELVMEMLHAHVHRTLTITKMTMAHAGKKTLTEKHIRFGTCLAEDMV
jgi:histone H3/H4